MSKCRSCAAPIIWARTTTGKMMPVDAEEMGGWDAPTIDSQGNLRPTGASAATQFGSAPIVEVMSGPELFPAVGDPDGGRRWRPHFSTCPDRDDWSRS